MKPLTFILGALAMVCVLGPSYAAPVEDALARIDAKRGLVCLAGLPEGDPGFPVKLANAAELTLFVQSADRDQIRAVQQSAEKAGLLGSRIFAATGSLDSLHLADNLADAVLIAPDVADAVPEEQLRRVLRPLGPAWVGGNLKLVKAVPEGIDDWSHPYHGPDNNPNSNDQFVRGRFRTQFVAEPKFSPMPEQTVAAGGRLFKAMGHIAHKANQNAMLNTLLGINAYNGIILWKRDLPKGFMIHRNTMIAADDALYMGDHESCKVIDAKTGEIRDEINVPEDITDGPTWKWMALRDGVLYALVGNKEIAIETQKSVRRGLGHWPWGMWDGHDYNDPRTSFGFGRTLVAIDLKAKRVLWHYRDAEFLDARAVCMNSRHIFCFTPEKFLACVDHKTGKLLWKNSDADLLAAIGPNGRAQHYVTGYATTSYIKCSDDFVFFAGPQREKMVVASANDGKLAWTHPTGNLQLVLRDDGVYAAGSQKSAGGAKFDYATGKVLAEFPARRACTRATGCIDSIFFRASGGTVRIRTESNVAQHIAPMRPPCQDGVIISNGHLYWGPWMCGCQLSLYGNIGLAPALEVAPSPDPEEIFADALKVYGDKPANVEKLGANADDWTRFRGNPARTDETGVALPKKVSQKWKTQVGTGDLATAPVAAGGLVFVAGRNGVVRAIDAENGGEIWKSHTDGPVYYPPAISHDRLFVGSADGRVYAFEARTGKLLWTFRVGPKERLVPVFGKLISAWPVAGGIAAHDKTKTVYAAGGFTHYDGCYVVALDAVTGKLKASNTTSGTLSSEVESGISLQGNLKIADGELRFLGGGVYEVARYDLETLRCLNEPKIQITSEFRTAFYPYYPSYGKYISLEHERADGSLLVHDSNYAGYLYGALQLQDAGPRMHRDAAREFLRRRGQTQKAKVRWKDDRQRRFTSFIVSGDQLLATGHPDEKEDEAFLAAIDIAGGSDLWVEKLPAAAVKGGCAIDAKGRIFLTLENGLLVCYGD